MNELPKGWSECRLDDISTIITGKTPSKNHIEYFGGSIPFIKPGDVNNQGYIVLTQETLTDSGANTVPIIPANSITVTCIGNLGRVGITTKSSATNQQINSVVTSPLIATKYIYYYLRTIKPWMESEASATTVTILNKSRFSAAPIYLAPLNEQIRIADKLDSILAKVDQAQARLEKIPHILKRFRQSVLAAATSGELTREWREGNDHQWPKVELKDVGTGFNYGSSTKSKPEGDVPVLRMGNLQGGKLDWERLVFTSDEAEINKYLLESGDVLFNRTNSPELVGKTSIYRGEQKAIYAGYLIRVKGSKRLNTEFLNIQLNSPHARDYCWQVKTDGVSQSNINAKKLQAYEFDLPSIEEQLEIVRRVNELFSHAALFERQYLDSKRRFDKLTQAILAKAFRGELVEQGENDEPASELLARILTSKEDNSSAKSKKKSVSKVVNIDSNDDRTAKGIDQASVIKWIGDLKEDTFRDEDLNESFGSDYEQLKEILFSLLKEDKPMITKVFDVTRKDFMFKKV